MIDAIKLLREGVERCRGRIQTLIPNMASMSFMYMHQATGQYILAFLHMDSWHLLYLLLLQHLVCGRVAHSSREESTHRHCTQLNTPEPSSRSHNLGTPSISIAQYMDNFWTLYVCFHFTTDDVRDPYTYNFMATIYTMYI
ncbi:hypothetical protein EON65_25565 [archaeon]|nr:MAG: hypothetical protein EON65_25565 [archaeon]